MLTLISLPVDILILVLETLGLKEFATLSLTCRAMYAIVTEYGWSKYIRSNPRPSPSLANARAQWHPRVRARYDVMTDSAWKQSEFIARPLSRMWAGKQAPSMAITPSRLVIGAGSNLYSYKFGTSTPPSASPPVLFEGVVSLLEHPEQARNITALTFIGDGGLDQTLEVGFQNGAIERVHLTTTHKHGEQPSLYCTRSKLDSIPNGDFLENLSSESNIVLSLSANGYATLTSDHADHSSTSNPSSTIELKSRSWVSHLSLQSSTPFAVFGVASTTPLNVHAINDGGQLSQRPMAILHTKKGGDMPLDKLSSSAVYGVSRGPLNSPWGASPQIIVSGWYDGQVRCYDLRSSSRVSAASAPRRNESPATNDPAPLRPVLSLADRWSYEPIYSVSCGGGSASHIAAGTARHSVVSFWDVRSPSTGWSVHAPGNDPSPVYSVILESSRFFGVTQSRPFVYDFGPGVSLDTYPSIPQVRGIDNLKQKKGSNRATYHVLRYTHNGSGLCNEH